MASCVDMRANVVPVLGSLHASFDYAKVPDDTILRESIEIRFLVVIYTL